MKIVLQDGMKDCGVCSLLSIIRFYGGDVSKEYLREITNTTKNGVSAYNLIEGAKKIGFEATGVCGDMTNLDKNNLPCLAHLVFGKGYKHFVVIYKINKDLEKVYIMDPARGKVVLSFSEFRLYSTQNFILLKPLLKMPYINNKKVIKNTIIKVMKDNKKMIILLSIFIISYFVFNILAAFHLKYLSEIVINYNVLTNHFIITLIVCIVYFFKIISGYIKNILFIKITSIIDYVLTTKTFRQILLLPYLFYKNRTTGEVITRLKDLSLVKNFFIKLFSVLVTDMISLIIFLILMINLNLEISLIIIFVVSVFLIFITLRSKFKRKYYVKVLNSEEKTNSYLIESLSNVDTIKGGHIEKKLFDKFTIIYKDLLDKNYLYMLFISINQFVKENIKDILMLIVYGLGTVFVLDDKMSVENIFLYQTFFMYFFSSVISIIDVIDEYYTYKVSLKRVEDLYTICGEKFEGSYYYYNFSLDKDIVFKNLKYCYGNRKILDGINLVIKNGEKLLLIGENGSGKSSLVKILMRYLDVPYGMCSIGDIDINHYHLENIRKNISYVSSNDFLFTDTLYNNLTLENDVSDDILEIVMKVTKVDEILKKRDVDYKMMVEENGFNFSNGERQRIILCRYLLRNSNIYIFDEALGQIDIFTEREILINMFKFLKDKTVIVISHRINNKDIFDRIIKLEEGIIYEEKV